MRALLLLFLAVPLSAQTPPSPGQSASGAEPPGLQVKEVVDHNGGLVTFYSGNRLLDSQSQVATNVFFDRDSGVTKRGGQTLFSNIAGCSSQVRAEASYSNPNGTNYLFAVCGGNVYESKGMGFSVIGGTISATAAVYMRQGLGVEWFTDGVDALWSTDGVNVSSYTSAPLAQLNGIYQSRVVLGNVVGGESTIYLSGYNNGGDYILPAVIVDTSPAIFGLNGLNNGLNVTCISDSYRDVLILWNINEMYGLYGSGNSSFILRKLADIGCQDPGSIQEFDHKLKWLSTYGVYEYDGLNTRRISDNVKDQIQNIINTSPGSLSLTQNTQSQWLTGNLTVSGLGAPMSATISPNNVVPSTWSITDSNFSAPYNPVAFVNLSTEDVPGSITLLHSTFAFSNGNFNTGDFTNWTHSGGNGWSINSTNGSGSACANLEGLTPNFAESLGIYAPTPGINTGNEVFEVDDNNGNLIKKCTVTFTGIPIVESDNCDISVSSGTMSPGTVQLVGLNIPNASNYVGMKLKFTDSAGGILTGPVSSEANQAFASIGAFYQGAFPIVSFMTKTCSIGNYMLSGTLTSTAYNTAFSTPTWGLFNVTQSIPSSTAISYTTQVSADNITYDGGVSATPGNKIPSASKQYIKYNANFSNMVATATPNISADNLSADTTGYFITGCFPTSPNAGWGLFQANTISGNGALTFSVSTGTTCGSVQVATATWTSQSLNQNISVSTASYLGVRVLFNGMPFFDSLNQPTLQSITVNWISQAGRPHVASQVFDNRYWLAYTTSTAGTAFNNNVLVYDSMGHWSKFSGINASSFATYNLNLYAGSSLSDGNVLLENSGLTDNGSPILFDYRTPDYELDAFSLVDMYDLNLEFAAVPMGFFPSMQIKYYADNSSKAYALGSVPLTIGTPGLVYSTQRVPDNGNPARMHTFGFELTDNTSTPITFYRSMIRFMPLEGP